MRVTDIEIIEIIGSLATRKGRDGNTQTLDFCLVRINCGRPIYNLRWWSEGQPLNGVSLTERTLAELGDLIDEVFKMEKK